jgi:hypothetical protein
VQRGGGGPEPTRRGRGATDRPTAFPQLEQRHRCPRSITFSHGKRLDMAREIALLVFSFASPEIDGSDPTEVRVLEVCALDVHIDRRESPRDGLFVRHEEHAAHLCQDGPEPHPIKGTDDGAASARTCTRGVENSGPPRENRPETRGDLPHLLGVASGASPNAYSRISPLGPADRCRFGALLGRWTRRHSVPGPTDCGRPGAPGPYGLVGCAVWLSWGSREGLAPARRHSGSFWPREAPR